MYERFKNGIRPIVGVGLLSQSHVPMWKPSDHRAKSISDGEQPLVSAGEDVRE